MLLSMSNCPYCGGGYNTPCFAKYSNGYKCFSCGVHSTHQQNYRIEGENNTKQMGTNIPNYTKDVNKFSVEALQYFHKYNLTTDILTSYSIGYVNDGSVIFPLWNGPELKGYQQRWLKNKKFKTYGKNPYIYFPKNKRLVIVEDYISALRVSEYASVLGLLGTSITKDAVDYIVKNYTSVDVWLDGDFAGQKAADKLIKKLIYNYEKFKLKYNFVIRPLSLRIINTSKDPKTYSNKEIKELLNA